MTDALYNAITDTCSVPGCQRTPEVAGKCMYHKPGGYLLKNPDDKGFDSGAPSKWTKEPPTAITGKYSDHYWNRVDQILMLVEVAHQPEGLCVFHAGRMCGLASTFGGEWQKVADPEP